MKLQSLIFQKMTLLGGTQHFHIEDMSSYMLIQKLTIFRKKNTVNFIMILLKEIS